MQLPEALLADVVGRPVHGRVVLREALVEILNAHVPRVDRAVDERSVGAVAERIRVDDRRLVHKLSARLEHLDDVLVAVLAEASLELGDSGREGAGLVERIDKRVHSRLAADAEVVLAVRRRDVDESDAVVRRHVVVVEDAERALSALVGEVRENRLIFDALERRALELRDDFVLLLLLEDVRKPRPRHDVDGPRVVSHVAHCDIVDVRARADREVLGKRPGSGSPDQEIDVRRRRYHGQGLGAARGPVRCPSHHLRPHRHGRILHVLVVAARLEVGERGRELPAVGHDAVRAVDASLVPELLEHPPHGLHEAEVHRLVVVVEVDPAAHARNRLAPFGDVLEHHRAALLVELVYAERLDLVRARDAKRVLREGLDRESVSVPPEAALDVLAAHRLVARDDVLDRAREEMPVMRKAGGERRPVVELVALSARVLHKGLLERLALFPHLKDGLFHLRKCHLV